VKASGGKKRGPKGERYDDSKALSAMAPLVRKGLSELSAATHVVRQGLADAATKQNEMATIERVRRKFRADRDKLMTRKARSAPVYPTINPFLLNHLAASPQDFLWISFADQLEPPHVRALREASKHSIARQVEAALLQSPTDQLLAAAVRSSQVDQYLLAGGSEIERALALATHSPFEEALKAAGLLSPLLDGIMSKTGLRRR
jgi:hypothetical protein